MVESAKKYVPKKPKDRFVIVQKWNSYINDIWFVNKTSWYFWGLSHACCISKMRHNKVETSVSPEKNYMIEKNEISQMGGAYLMSQKLKICK